jgi:hypothetical protein
MVTNPSIEQKGGSWEITYKMPPEKKNIKFVSAYVEGDVSNSAVPGHFRSQYIISRAIWNKENSPKVLRESVLGSTCVEKAKMTFDESSRKILLTLEHDHSVYGKFEPLLGKRVLTLNIDGEEKTFDLDFTPCYNRTKLKKLTNKMSFEYSINKEGYADKYDPEKDELFLSLSQTNGYFRSAEIPTRWDTVYTVKFKYMVFYGSIAQPVFFISEYCDVNTSWKMLGKTIDVELDRTPGRWHQYKKTFRTKSEASTMAYNFSLRDLNPNGPSVGDMLVRDFEISPPAALTEIQNP